MRARGRPLGELARAALAALDGRELTARELRAEACMSTRAAVAVLSRLVAAGRVEVRRREWCSHSTRPVHVYALRAESAPPGAGLADVFRPLASRRCA